MGEPEDGGHEHVEEVLLLLDGVVQERVLEPEAGVVDQQADRPGGVGHPGLDRRELLAVAEVGHDHLDRDAVLRGQVGGQPLQPLAGAGDDDQVVALGGEPVGEGPADARGGAGDEDGRAVLGRGGGLRHAAQHSWTDVETATTLRHDGKVPASKTKILAVANQKGGVAKTTTVASLGAALAELGHRVLLVDLDPQACLTFSLGIDPEDLELSIHHVLTKGLDATEVMIATEDGVDLLPATIELARAEADLLTRTGREHVVKMALEDLADYDWVLLDCPPSLGVLTVAALTAARRRADPAAVRDAVAPRGGAAARHRPRRTPVHQPQARGLGRAADAVRRPHQPRPRGAGQHLRDLPARRHRAADPEVDPVRRGAGRGPLDPEHQPHHKGADAYREVAASLTRRGR